jgi:D-alanyl-lipoteichoic acid acyltransferase DltB (MBOAT superfamily)
MTFNSIPFLIFYPCVLLGYFGTRLLPEKIGSQARWIFLLLASYFFYMYSQPALIVLILFTTLVSWVSSLVIEKLDLKIASGALSEKEIARARRQKKWCLALTLISSLGVLFFFKYFIFICESVFGIVGLFTGQAYRINLDLILPVGISFYTFQTLSYAIDVYRGKIRTERHFGYYALFVSFFPAARRRTDRAPRQPAPAAPHPSPRFAGGRGLRAPEDDARLLQEDRRRGPDLGLRQLDLQ